MADAPITVPPMYCPIPRRNHPRAAEAEAHTMDWAERFGLYWDEEQLRRVRGMESGRLAAFAAPVGGFELLKVYADFTTWAFAFDDEYLR
ncbi:isoprenoid biosynthesis enzyme family protein [Streptomyces halobius]|uniref:Uncharacterized protein n=1 Tax=Streptomyces halobius TaxID=2879846 RepID=A0ABY4LYZ8_9ACTN|nr:hypothetical protein [Streptomyces halobius]UQA90711.1 hypothetical protein K9S39_01335 [Streptomyces halobius]